MNNKKRGLGRGLDALLQGLKDPISLSVEEREEKKPSGEFRFLPIEQLQRNPFQPRHDFDEAALQSLSDSIRSQGVLQPILVRMINLQRYEIIAGERRWRAAQLAGLSEVPVLIKEIPDNISLALALIENIQRENLNSIEEALALQNLMTEFKMTHAEIADLIGRSRTAVTNILRLLNLEEFVQNQLKERKLEMGHARALLALDQLQQRKAAEQIIAKALSVRAAERLVQSWLKRVKSEPREVQQDPDILRLQRELSEKLGTQVTFKSLPKGQGQLIIYYHDLDTLEGILNHIQ